MNPLIISFFVYILLPVLVLSQRVTLTDLVGNVRATISTAQQVFTWTIAPSIPVSRIQLVFEGINIQTSELNIGDTSAIGNGVFLWNCAQCGSSIPPPIFSTTGSISISFISAVSKNFYSSFFNVKYIGIPISYTNIPTNISFYFPMGNAPLTPVRSDGKIPPNSIQTWKIDQRSSTSSSPVLITFMFSRLSLMSNCQDTLTITDSLDNQGNVIFSGCSSNQLPLNWIYSMTGTSYLVFKTGNQVSTSNFLISYFADVPLFQCGSFLNPNFLTGDSMIVSDGSGSNNLMRRGASCSWNITQPQTTGTVSLVFTMVSLMFGSSVIVSDSNGVVLWNGAGATSTIPPIITSSGKSLFITYASSSSNPVIYRGFFGDYYTNYVGSIGSGRKNSTLMMSSLIDLFPPGDGVTSTAGVNYTWILQPSNILGKLMFAFSELKLINPGDQLLLYDGTDTSTSPIGVFINQSYSPTQWFQTSASSALLVYQSANKLSSRAIAGNFRLSYYGDGPNYHCGFIRNPALLTMSSFTITDGSRSTEIIYINQYCEWNIQPTGGIVRGIYLFFNRFSLFSAQINIYLNTVASGNLYTIISQTNAIPSAIYIPYSSIGISYSSKASTAGYGFSITYYAVYDDVQYTPPDLLIAPYSSIVSFPGNNVVNLMSSSMYSLKLSEASSANIRPRTTLTWSIVPNNAKGKIYFALTKLSLSTCDQGSLNFYDTSQSQALTSSNLIWSFCGDTNSYSHLMTPYQWIATSSNTAIVQYVTQNASLSNQQQNDFELSYYTDGSAYHCGFINNPAVLTAPSFIFSDGSSSVQAMASGQLCEWLIQPQIYRNYSNTTSTPKTETPDNPQVTDFITVIEFLSLDLTGGEIYIYAKDKSDSLATSNQAYANVSAKDTLLWSCQGCTVLPRPIIINSVQTIYVKFSTASSTTTLGSGFTAFYWTTTLDDWRNYNTSGAEDRGSIMLEVPDGVILDHSMNNRSTSFHLSVSSSLSSLSFYPTYQSTETIALDNQEVFDGRTAASTELQSISTTPITCGIVTGIPAKDTVTNTMRPITASLRSYDNFYYGLTQSSQYYLKSNINSKTLLSLQGSFDYNPSPNSTSLNNNNNNINNQAQFTSPLVCKYWLENSEFTALSKKQAISITINLVSITNNGRLRIYGGLIGDDNLLFDSNIAKVTYPVNVTMPCGRGLVFLESNSTNKSTTIVDYGFQIGYSLVNNDQGAICQAYYDSLYPPPEKPDPYTPYYIAAGVIAGFGVAAIGLYYAMKIKKRRGFVFFQSDYKIVTKKYLSVTPSHPKYNPTWNKFFNRFLPRGTCSICKSENMSVLMMKCKHGICIEDTKGYVLSALGDISMFPIKCPMHFDGCNGHIDAYIAQRVLNEQQYCRFIEFSDRATYGDGMRCIFCQNYVCFPNDMTRMTQVECPYCIQKFCVKCKKPWHYNNQKCPVDMLDASLEVWKKKSGAQTCPSCNKIIEKDDPDTCNHMVHKITDSIPCCRDRTDFCYLCGEEVTADYPHDEVQHPGVNHFPEGVFQNCRRIIQKEKEKERERELLRKQRRRRGNTGNGRSAPVVPTAADDEFLWDDTLTDLPTPYNTPLTRSIGVGGGAVTPSTPQIIEFPLMEDEDFIPPVERNPGNYAASITSPAFAQPGSNRPPSAFPMIQDPNSLSVRSVSSINSVTNLPTVTSPSIPAVPVNSPALTTPNRGTGRNTLPVRLNDNDEDSIASSQIMRNYDNFDEEWGVILRDGGVYPTPTHSTGRGTSVHNSVNNTTANTPMTTPISSPVRTARSDRTNNRTPAGRTVADQNDPNIHRSIANGGRFRFSTAVTAPNSPQTAPNPLASRSTPASPLVTRNRFNPNN